MIGQFVLEEQYVLVEHDLLLLFQLLHVDAVVCALRRQLLVSEQRALIVGAERPVERPRHRVDVRHVTAAAHTEDSGVSGTSPLQDIRRLVTGPEQH